MSNIVKLVVNEETVLQFDRDISIPENQKAFLMQMEIKMSGGFDLAGEFIKKPDLMQKAQFVALNMLDYINQENFNMAIGLFTYIVSSMPDLKQLEAVGSGNDYKIEFNFDEDLGQWQTVNFT